MLINLNVRCKCYNFKLTIKAIFTQCEPILDASYSTVMYTGRMGTAMIPKVMSNMLCCAQVVAMGEILMIGRRLADWHSSRILNLQGVPQNYNRKLESLLEAVCITLIHIYIV